VRSVSGLAFYDWETTSLVRRVEITPKLIFWNESGELVCIATDESFFVLRYNAEAIDKAKERPDIVTEDGIEEAFDVVSDIQESVRTGCWVGDCFIYTNSVNRLNYYVGGEIVTIAHLDRVMYLLGYIPKDNRVYLGDKELNVVSYSLLLSVLEYQTAVMRRDFETADKVLPTVPREQRTRVAHFLEKQGFKPQAMAVTCDPEHKFELALQLGDLKIAYQLAKEAEAEQKWKQLAELATSRCEFGLAQECLHQAQDYGGLLLLASASGNADIMGRIGVGANQAGQNNVAFLSYFMLGNLEECLNILISTGRLPEAAFFARTYLPSQLSRVVTQWRESLAKKNSKAAQSLANPAEYENLFPGLNDGLRTEQFLRAQRRRLLPARAYPTVPANHERQPVAEMLEAEEAGTFSYIPPAPADDEETDLAAEEGPVSPPPSPQPTENVTAAKAPRTPVAAAVPVVAATPEKSPSQPPHPPAAATPAQIPAAAATPVVPRVPPTPPQDVPPAKPTSPPQAAVVKDSMPTSSAPPPVAPSSTPSAPTKAPTSTPGAQIAANRLEELETELELDLENMKLENIDTTGIETEDLDDWE